MENPTAETEPTAAVTKEVEVQFSLKWINFVISVEATSVENAKQLAYRSFEKHGLKNFTIKARGEDVTSLKEIFRKSWLSQVSDEDGNEGDSCFYTEEDED